MKKIINTTNAPDAIGPYSQAIAANGLVFISGQLPVVPATGNFPSDCVEAQTQQSLENVQAILNAANCSLADVVKTTVFLKDMSDFPKVNAVYAKFFKEDCPARACIEVARLPKDALVEIEAIAIYQK